MSKEGRIRRIRPILQSKLSEYLRSGYNPTTEELVQSVFDSEYKKDSRIQRDTIYFALLIIRDEAIKAWENYVVTPQYFSDLSQIEYYQQNKVEETFATNDFALFYIDLMQGKFRDKTKEFKEYTKEFGHIAVLWDIKMKEFLNRGICLVIAEYGKKSKWYIPTFWSWARRDTDLYIRTLNILKNQLERGKNTKIGLPSGERIERALEYTGSLKALIKDGTSWICECKMVNPQEANYCSNCGKSKSI